MVLISNPNHGFVPDHLLAHLFAQTGETGQKKNIHQRLITSLLGEVYHQRVRSSSFMFIKSNPDFKNQTMNIKVPKKNNSADSGVSKKIFDQLGKTSEITGDYLLGGEGCKQINWWIISRNVSSYTKGHIFFWWPFVFTQKWLNAGCNNRISLEEKRQACLKLTHSHPWILTWNIIIDLRSWFAGSSR